MYDLYYAFYLHWMGHRWGDGEERVGEDNKCFEGELLLCGDNKCFVRREDSG